MQLAPAIREGERLYIFARFNLSQIAVPRDQALTLIADDELSADGEVVP